MLSAYIACFSLSAASVAQVGDPAALLAAALPEELLPNGGFELGAEGWGGGTGLPDGLPAGVVTEGSGLVAQGARSGDRALRLDARGLTSEVGVGSATVPIRGGATYVLSAYAAHLGGNAGYKVTLDWLDAAGKHLSYDNDWRGNTADAAYVFHGGAFRAPGDAAAVRVLVGVSAGSAYLLDDLSLRLMGPLVRIESFGPEHAVYTAGEAARLSVSVINDGGQPAGAVTMTLEPTATLPEPAERRVYEGVGDLEPGKRGGQTWTLDRMPEGVHTVTVAVTSPGREWTRATADLVVVKDLAAETRSVASGTAALSFGRIGDDYGPARLLAGDEELARLRALGEVAVRTAGGEDTRLILAHDVSTDGDALAFDAAFTDADNAPWHATARVAPLAADPGSLRYTVDAWCDQPREVLAFRGPLLFVDDAGGGRKDDAVFPGLEFLRADEQSSATTSVASPLNLRHAVHPYKVTVPFVCIARAGRSVMLEWDPLQQWDGTHVAPTPLFSVPNAYLGQSGNMLMGLQVPSIPEWARENEQYASQPYPLPAGQHLVLTATIRTADAPEGIVGAIRDYFTRHGPAPLPTPPRDWQQGLDLCVQGFTHAWNEEAKGWLQTNTGPTSYVDGIAAILARYVRAYPESPLATEARRELDGTASVMVPPPGMEHGFLRGQVGVVALVARTSIAGLAAGQREDGSWGFAPSEKTASLGEAGASELGQCAEPCHRLLRMARVFGYADALAAGLKGLDYIDAHFVRPAGGETWEVPLHAPNLRATALAVHAFTDAYRITGEERYLKSARYWAYAGLPFIYQWQAPDRPVMPYCSISVFGATFFTFPWFGNAVQWVGLAYAQSLYDLADVDDSFAWAGVARGITLSAMQQQKTAESSCGDVGFFPDSYCPVTGADTYHWCLQPSLIAECILHELSMPLVVNTVVLRPEGCPRLHISSLAPIDSAELAGDALRVGVGAVPEESAYLSASSMDRPAGVTVDGAAAAEDRALRSDVTWSFDVATRRLIIRLPGAGAKAVELQGVTPREDGGDALDALVGGDFEDGLSVWTPSPADRVSIVLGEIGPSAALALDARTSAEEVQAFSLFIRIEPGTRYRLSSRVRLTDGDVDYKVTLDWRDARGALIRYDNDWQGKDRPRQTVEHGGVFTAPPDAARVRIILGVRQRGRCVFDDVVLEREG